MDDVIAVALHDAPLALELNGSAYTHMKEKPGQKKTNTRRQISDSITYPSERVPSKGTATIDARLDAGQ